MKYCWKIGQWRSATRQLLSQHPQKSARRCTYLQTEQSEREKRMTIHPRRIKDRDPPEARRCHARTNPWADNGTGEDEQDTPVRARAGVNKFSSISLEADIHEGPPAATVRAAAPLKNAEMDRTFFCSGVLYTRQICQTSLFARMSLRKNDWAWNFRSFGAGGACRRSEFEKKSRRRRRDWKSW